MHAVRGGRRHRARRRGGRGGVPRAVSPGRRERERLRALHAVRLGDFPGPPPPHPTPTTQAPESRGPAPAPCGAHSPLPPAPPRSPRAAPRAASLARRAATPPRAARRRPPTAAWPATSTSYGCRLRLPRSSRAPPARRAPRARRGRRRQQQQQQQSWYGCRQRYAVSVTTRDLSELAQWSFSWAGGGPCGGLRAGCRVCIKSSQAASTRRRSRERSWLLHIHSLARAP